MNIRPIRNEDFKENPAKTYAKKQRECKKY